MESINLSIKRVAGEQFGYDGPIDTGPSDPKYGDVSTNIAFKIAPGAGKTPLEVAKILRDELLSTDNKDIADVDVAGPGFVNIRLSDSYFGKQLNLLLDSGSSYGKTKKFQGKTVVVEFSDPNPFKELHIGHFYTSIVGNTIANLYEAAGADVYRVNFGGDVGLHVAKAMWAIINKLGKDKVASLEAIPVADRASWLSERYVEGSEAYEINPTAKTEIIDINKRIYGLSTTSKDEFSKVYFKCREWSYEYFDKFYKDIGIEFDKYYPESETANLGLETAREWLERGILSESDGAVIFNGEAHGLHTRVFITREGLPTYEAKDIGLAIKKSKDYKIDKSIILTGNDIIEYMKVILKALELAGHDFPKKTNHITHGLVKLSGGQKMSSRTGNVVRATELLANLKEAASKINQNTSESVAIAAANYAFLSHRLGGDILFDIRQSVTTDGNSGPYLQYALVRAKSILGKDSNSFAKESNTDFEEDERQLLHMVIQFPDVVARSTNDLQPHLICVYLYELAQEFNRFYEKNRIIGDDRQVARVKIVKAYSQVLENGLKLMGIPILEHM